MKRRIIFTGAQGTGKSTVLKMFEEVGYPVITEVVRTLVKTKNIPINEKGTNEGQLMIWEEYKKRLAEEAYVSDRGLTDVLAYSLVGSADDNLNSRLLVEFADWSDTNLDVVYIYFPIEFPVVDDGVRSVNEDYREQVDSAIQQILEDFEIPHLKVTGTPEERFKQILDYAGPDLF